MSIGLRLAVSLAALTLFVAVSGCGGGGGGSSSPGGSDPLPPKTLSWSPPSSYTDNTPLNPLTDLDSFEIYVSESGAFSESDAPVALVGAIDLATGGLTTSFNLANLGPYLSRGVTYRVSLRSVALTGLKSDFSPSASFSL